MWSDSRIHRRLVLLGWPISDDIRVSAIDRHSLYCTAVVVVLVIVVLIIVVVAVQQCIYFVRKKNESIACNLHVNCNIVLVGVSWVLFSKLNETRKWV